MIVVPTISAHLLSRAGEDDGFSKYENTVIGDMAKAKRLTRSRPTWNEDLIYQTDTAGRMWRIYPHAHEVKWFFERYAVACARWPQLVPTGLLSLVVDVETTKDAPLLSQLICIGFGFSAPDEEQVLNVPILNCGGSRYWTPNDELYVRQIVASFVARPEITTTCHNKGFDRAVMWANGMPMLGWGWCSMSAHHVVDGEMPHNLGFVASTLTDGRYWKDDSKGDGGFLAIPDYTLRVYNLRDILATARTTPVLHRYLQQHRQWDCYIEELQCVDIMTRASIRGMLIDEKRRTSTEIDVKTGKCIGLKPQLELQRDEAIKLLRAIANNPSFEPSKPVQVQQLFFQKLKFPVVLTSDKTGAPKVDKEALMLLELLASTPEQRTALRAVIQFRQAEKFLGTFIDGLGKFVHPQTWRFHTQWKLLAVSGRFTSSPNAQNWSMLVKRMFTTAPGWSFLGVDLSQAELRYIAYLARDATLLKMYEQDINVHTVNACLLFKIRCPAPKDINPQTEAFIRSEMWRVHNVDYDSLPLPTLDQWKPIRTLAKNFVFGSNYGAETETVFKVLRSKRDPDTNKLLFPKLQVAEIQALRVMWLKRLHPEIPMWWDTVQAATRRKGGYYCPISNRARLFRGGFKRNEMLNYPIQTGVASWMNRCMVKIQARFDADTGGQAQILQQVHDALNSEVPDGYIVDGSRVKMEVMNQEFPLEGFRARLPADKVDVGRYLNEV